VYTVNEDYDSEGTASAEEKAELQRIRQEGHQAKLSVGTVHAYILTPDGHTADSLHVAQAARPETFRAMLERAVARFQPRAGQPVVTPTSQSRPPSAQTGDLILHVIARADERGSWGEFPAENWLLLSRSEWTKLLPPGKVKVGQRWELDAAVSASILTYFYPQVENNEAPTSRIEQQSLQARVLSCQDGVVTARIDGTLRLKHVFYPGRQDAQPVRASIVGLLTFTPGSLQPPQLQLVTQQAVHGQRRFAVAVLSHSSQQ
jgi:hypothetical protein